MNGQARQLAGAGSMRVRNRARAEYAGGCALLFALVLCVAPLSVRADDPLVVISVQSGAGTDVCNTDCVDCVPPSPECIHVDEEDLILCTPQSSGLPITSCHWSLYMQGDSPALQINTQLRAAEVAPNGNIVFVALSDTTVPGIGAVESDDMIVFTPDDLFKPFTGGGPYDDGTLKFYLNGDLSQSIATAKPWDAIEILPDGTCERAIDATKSDDHSCTIIGSLSGGTPGTGLDGVHAKDEDLVRCIPDAFAANGAVEGCAFSLFLYTSRINGIGNGFTSEIKAIDMLSFDQTTMAGELIFKKGGGTPPGFPVHDNGKDLLLYTGTFGVGLCVPSNKPCASVADCLGGDSSCNTGSCSIGAAPCAHDDDCSGAGNVCVNPRSESGVVTKFFDGVAVGLTGTGQNIEAFSVLNESDGDGVPDGSDNCPSVFNPPGACSGPGSETCPSGLSSECPPSETCEQADSDDDDVGDACDQCNGRPDEGTCDECPSGLCPAPCGGSPTADCACGDNILDLPSEQCDLGGQNGAMGSPCSLACEIAATCTRSMLPCGQGSDCSQFASGEGCCGDGIRDDVDGPGGVVPDEDCDDGNDINNDVCDTSCSAVAGGTEIVGCDGLLGPNVIPGAVKLSKFKDTPSIAEFDRWKTKGEAIFTTGLTIDPDSQDVTIIYNNTPNGTLFTSTLSPPNCNPPLASCFVQSGSVTKPKWKFKDKEADVPGSPSWRKGIFKIKPGNKLVFNLDGRNEPLFTLLDIGGPPLQFRQTIRVDDICITTMLNCNLSGNGKSMKCLTLP